MPISRVAAGLFLALSLLAAPASAQTAPAGQAAAATTPWLYQGSDVPQDPEWRFGVLPNGLRYAVRRNGVPPGQVAVRVRIDAGSLMETDSERGFAHLIEHLSFRGSEHVPDGESKRIWQRLGATFGSDTNASTTHTGTVYKLDLPGDAEYPAQIAENLNASLKILAGMVSSPTLTQAALDAERPVVMAEGRESQGAQLRSQEAMMALLFAGQPIAQRMPIGTTTALAAATPDTVRAFHDRWYRPERAVVIVVGDLDVSQLEKLVVENFSDWRGSGPAPREPDFGKPVANAAKTRVLVEPDVAPNILLAVVRPWTLFADTVIFNQNRMVDMIALRIMNRRLETQARRGASYLLARAALDDIARSGNVTTVSIQPQQADWAAALRDVRAVIADALKTPPSQGEIDRELAEMDAGLQQDIATWAVTSGALLADNMSDAVDIHETMTSPDRSRAIFRGAIDRGMFTSAAVFAASQRVFKGTATRAMLVANKPDPRAQARLSAALTAPAVTVKRAAAQATVSFDALPSLGTPTPVVSRRTVIAQPMVEQVDFANGVKLLTHASTSEPAKVYVRVRFGDGLSGVPADKTSPAWTGNALLPAGIAGFGQEELDLLTGNRQISMEFAIDSDAFVFGALTTAGDLSDQLKLFAAKLNAPRWDTAPLERLKAAMLARYAGMDSAPDAVLGRDLERLLHNGDRRWGVPTRDEIIALTPAAFRAFWEPRLASGPIEVQVFGDVATDAVIAAVGSTFGALPSRDRPTAAAVPTQFPDHVATPVTMRHRGQPDQAAAVIAWPTGGGSGDIREMRKLEVLAQLFGDRLIDRLRSQAGVSYSPSVDSSWPIGFTKGGRIIAVGLVPPDKADFFFGLVREIAADLVAKPIDEDEMRRALVPMAQQLIRGSTTNAFWMQLASGGTRDPVRLTAVGAVIDDVASTTPQEVQALAAKYLRPDRDWTFMVLPTERPAPKLAAQAPAKPGAAKPSR